VDVPQQSSQNHDPQNHEEQNGQTRTMGDLHDFVFHDFVFHDAFTCVRQRQPLRAWFRRPIPIAQEGSLSMRFFSVLLVAIFTCQIAQAQPTARELITKFRKTIGAEANTGSVPYLIQYRGQRYLYSLQGGKLLGDVFEFDSKLYGFTGKRNKHRKEWEMKIGIVPFKIVEVIDGTSGWYQINEGEGVTMSKAALVGQEQREHHIEVFLGRESFPDKVWQFSETKSALCAVRIPGCLKPGPSPTNPRPCALSSSPVCYCA